MWAQMIKSRLKPGREDDLPGLMDDLHALEQPDSGLIRAFTLRDQNDRNDVYMLVVFESEEKARERESDPRRQEGLTAVREKMAEVFDGPPDFVDLEVVGEFVP